MNWTWLEIAALISVGLGVTLGVAGVTYLYLMRPAFWWGMLVFLWGKFGPEIVKVILKIFARMPAEEEAAWRAAERAGQGKEWLQERQRRKAREYWEKKRNDNAGR